MNPHPTVRSNCEHPEECVTRYRNQQHWTLVIITARRVACGTLRADDPSGESLLTVGNQFETKEFDTESLPAWR